MYEKRDAVRETCEEHSIGDGQDHFVRADQSFSEQ